MSLIQARTPPGVMELLPLDQVAFQRLLDAIRQAYERFGFLPIETPAFEEREVLLTKSGGETERQVYLVQSSGARSQGQEPDLALRFDLTVPLARYVAQHERELVFPFRRYQIQRVYRGESAQRGRYREFYQCDIDVIGKDQLSLRHDAELVAVIDGLFRELAVGPFEIRLNHRGLLRAMLVHFGVTDAEAQTLVLREIDKLDKRGAAVVAASLAELGLPAPVTAAVLDFVGQRARGHAQALQLLAALPAGAEIAAAAGELRSILETVRALGVPESGVVLDFSIARGLDYYTGVVYETVLTEHPGIGSVCSGGRYENLASYYTKSRLPGVGISIGATRLYYQLQRAGLLPPARSTVKLLVTLMDQDLFPACAELAGEARNAGINTELVLEAKKLGRQLSYAGRAGIPFALIHGSDEHARGVVQIKNLRTGDQFELPRQGFLSALRVELEQDAVLAAMQPQGG